MTLVRGALIPEQLWYWVEDQTWAELLPSGQVRVGITALGLKASGEIYMCRPKALGAAVEQGRAMAVVELAKSIVSVRSPISGTVTGRNELLASRPELVFEAPYGEGWLLELMPSNWDIERAALATGPELAARMEQWAWANQLG